MSDERRNETEMNPDAIRTLLARRVPGVDAAEIYHVLKFRCHRQTGNGESQAVILEVSDAGPDALREYRYNCVAVTEEGHFATGNGGPTLELALSVVHWNELDKEPDRGDWSYWPYAPRRR